ncbi:hypothetical protein NDU88_006370 [Pleurodeles waltl]|uniref:Uncharacterized protein n=1 Tax=Pleurodeles waltl TaxID=8319 RepID=A0AAV7N258_PLEWA|nr:hypothetical protein NDU88_006370 [Pleurodeles waltl]
MAGGSPRAGAGDSGSSKAGAGDEAPGERRPSPASVPPDRRVQPAGRTRDAEECPRLPQRGGSPTAGTGEAPGTWTSVDPRSSHAGLLDIRRTLKPRPGRQGPGRSSVSGEAPEGKRRLGFTLKSDPVPRELLEVRQSQRPSWL